MTESTPRSWEGFSHRYGSIEPDGEFWYQGFFGDERQARFRSSEPPVHVRVIEDPEGEYMGWLATHDRWDNPVEVKGVSMVLRSHIFDIQFPYGHETEVARGHGEAVTLRFEELGSDTQA